MDEDTFLVAAAGDTRTHYEWLKFIFGRYAVAQFFETTTRGYVLDDRLVAYIGSDFTANVNHDDVKKAIEAFQGLGYTIKTIGIGVVKDSQIQPWPAIKEMSLEEYLRLENQSSLK